MDEMRMKLSSKFMRNIASKLISRAIYKKTGCKVKIQINYLDALVIDGNATVKLNVEANLKSEDFNKIMESLDLD